MRDYQPMTNNPWLLPRSLYLRTLYTIRDYPRMKAEYDAVVSALPSRPAVRRGKGYHADPTADRAARAEHLLRETRAVESALRIVPEEYRKGLMDSITQFKRYPRDADPRTYRTWKQRFIFAVAENLGLTCFW